MHTTALTRPANNEKGQHAMPRSPATPKTKKPRNKKPKLRIIAYEYHLNLIGLKISKNSHIANITAIKQQKIMARPLNHSILAATFVGLFPTLIFEMSSFSLVNDQPNVKQSKAATTQQYAAIILGNVKVACISI